MSNTFVHQLINTEVHNYMSVVAVTPSSQTWVCVMLHLRGLCQCPTAQKLYKINDTAT